MFDRIHENAKIHWKTTVLESLFSKVAGLHRLQVFSCEFCKFLGTPLLQNNYGRLLPELNLCWVLELTLGLGIFSPAKVWNTHSLHKFGEVYSSYFLKWSLVFVQPAIYLFKLKLIALPLNMSMSAVMQRLSTKHTD